MRATPSPPVRVLLGYDGSPSAEAAVRDLHRAGLPAAGEAVVLSVADVWPHLPDGAWGAEPPDDATSATLPPAARQALQAATDALGKARAAAAKGADRLRAEFPGWRVTAEAVADSPYRALVAWADRWRPDLLVVGSHGRTAAGRLLLGSVSQQVLAHAVCSVRVARFRDDASRLAGDPVRLVIGVDGSPDSAAAVAAAAARTWPAESEAQVVMALDVPTSTILVGYAVPGVPWAYPVGDLASAGAWARHVTEDAAAQLAKAGLAAVPVVEAGDPKYVLPRLAEEWGADCVFVGAKGHSRLDRFLLGSVSASVAARARCSVEVIRPTG
jgi:nucleotide-binding universal stress UspA family protein